MLARRLPGVPVLVAEDRYLAGRLAECHLNCTVHYWTMGFSMCDWRGRWTSSCCRVRTSTDRPSPDAKRWTQPIRRMPSCWIATSPIAWRRCGTGCRGPNCFIAETTSGPPEVVESPGNTVQAAEGLRVVVVAAIARPERFVAAVEQAGFVIASRQMYRDHHRFSSKDVERMVDACRATGAAMVITTEKDVVRLLPYRPFPVTVAWLPTTLSIAPEAVFKNWLSARLDEAGGVAR